MALQCVRAIQFVVYGTAPKHGLVTLVSDIEPEVLGGVSVVTDDAHAARRSGPLGAGRRPAARARAALPDRGHRLQAHLLRHRAGLPVVAGPAADAVRRAGHRVHPRAAHRVQRPALQRDAADEHRAVRLLSGGDRRWPCTSVVGQEAIVRKTQFPRAIIPLAVVLTALFNLLVNLVAVVAFLLAFGVHPHVDVAAVPRPAGVAGGDHGRGLDDRGLAVPALPRHRDHLERVLDRAVLRHADLLRRRAARRPSRRSSTSS